MVRLVGWNPLGWLADWLNRDDQKALARVPPPEKYRQPGDSKIDIYSPTWSFLSAKLMDELEKVRLANDSFSKDSEATAALRGRIKLIKELLDLPNPPKERKKEIVPDDYAG